MDEQEEADQLDMVPTKLPKNNFMAKETVEILNDVQKLDTLFSTVDKKIKKN